MRSVLPLDVVPVDESHVHLVHERGRLEDVAASLACHLAGRHAVELLLHQRGKGIQGAVITVTPATNSAVMSASRLYSCPCGIFPRFRRQ